MKDLNEIVLVLGGSASGKSHFAEEIAQIGEKKYYLATMEKPKEGSAHFDEIKGRIMRHQENRAGKGFITLEIERDIEARLEEAVKGTADVILLESLSDFLSNEMFRGEDVISEKECEEKIFSAINALSKRSKRLVIVSDQIFSDGIAYEGATRSYMRCLAKLHRMIALNASRVFEVYYGIGKQLK